MKRMILLSVLTIGLGSPLLAAASYAPPIYAPHDNGLGKSQDGPHDDATLSSISVAPEPETYWLFLIGAATIGLYLRATARTREGAGT